MCDHRSVDIAPVSAERWGDLVALFERKGPRGGTPMPAGCWCMWWRQRTGDGARNKPAMEAIVAGFERVRPAGKRTDVRFAPATARPVQQ